MRKKRETFTYLALAASLLLGGCAQRAVPDAPPAAQSAPGEPVVAAQNLWNKAMVRLLPAQRLSAIMGQPGETETVRGYEAPIYYSFTYPLSEDEYISESIRSWIWEIRDAAVSGTWEPLGPDRRQAGRLDVTFRVYESDGSLPGGGRYAGIEAQGTLQHPWGQENSEILRVFLLHLDSRTQVDAGALLPDARRAEIGTLVREKLLKENPALAGALPETETEADWLARPLAREEGIEFLIGAEQIPLGEAGPYRILLTYEEMGTRLTQAEPLGHFVPRAGLDPEGPMVALTFDDGPDAVTRDILETLRQYGGRGTFFLIGNQIHAYGDTVRRAADQGCEIGSHSWRHSNLTKLSAAALEEDIQATSDMIFETAGVRPLLLRPPYGSYNSRVQQAAADQGVPLILWSVDTLDWSTRDAESTYQSVMENVRDGSIVLCHDLYGETAAAMQAVIPDLIAQGYQLVTVSELIHYKELTPEGGAVVRKG